MKRSQKETCFARKTLVGSHEKMNAKILNNHCIASVRVFYIVEFAYAVFRLERATEVLELTYLGKYFASVNAN